jgi:hypothetical protein
MSGARQEEYIGRRKQLMKLLRHTFIQVRVGVSENNSHGPPKIFKPMSYFRAGSYGRQQIFIQTEESGAGARHGFELLIQERRKFISKLSTPEESTDLPPIHSTKYQIIKHP